jgi:putative transposase
VVTRPDKRKAVCLLTDKGLSERQSCQLVGIDRNTHRLQTETNKDTELKQHIEQLAKEKPRYGYKRLTLLIRNEGYIVNHKRIYRIYRELNLAVKAKRRKKLKTCARGSIVLLATAPNQIWSMDYQSDQLASGRRFRCLNLVDNYTRECLAIEADTSLPSGSVVATLEQLKQLRGLPQKIMVDNGPEFRSKTLQKWALINKVELHFIDPGKPMQNGIIESFNGRVRDECLNLHWFLNLKDARQILLSWKNDYNLVRPHSSLKNQAPSQFAQLHPINKKRNNTTKMKKELQINQSRVS